MSTSTLFRGCHTSPVFSCLIARERHLHGIQRKMQVRGLFQTHFFSRLVIVSTTTRAISYHVTWSLVTSRVGIFPAPVITGSTCRVCRPNRPEPSERQTLWPFFTTSIQWKRYLVGSNPYYYRGRSYLALGGHS
jgi:hypothetical protein